MQCTHPEIRLTSLFISRAMSKSFKASRSMSKAMLSTRMVTRSVLPNDGKKRRR